MDLPNTLDIGRLRVLSSMVAEIVLDEGGDLTPWHLEHYIPAQTFSLAVYSGLIPEPIPPQGKGGVHFGDFRIDPKTRDAFLNALSGILEQLKKIAEEEPDPNFIIRSPWEEPTPAQLLKTFQASSGMSFVKIAEMARAHYEYSASGGGFEPVSERSVRRMRKPGHDVRPPIAKAVAKAIQVDDWQLLNWRIRKNI